MSAIKKLLQNDIILPSPPAVAIRILESVKKSDSSFEKLARIISSDPALAAKTLRVANSAFYSLPQKIDSIEKAVAVIGENALKNIALSFVITDNMRGLKEEGFDFDLFWKRAVIAAIAAELISTLVKIPKSDAFITALLQDIGIVIMYLCRSDDYMKVLDEKNASEESIAVVEKNNFGFDHQEVGSEILKMWGLPENIYAPILYHHNNEKPPAEHKALVDTLVISDKISSVYHGSHGINKIDDVRKILNIKYGINENEIENFIDSVAGRSVEVLSLFEIDPGDIKPYSQILQEANRELGRLNLSYENLLIEYKKEKERSTAFANKLKSSNEELRKIASRDGLTGLFNRRYFQDAMDKELSRAIRYARPFSLVMFDLDYFKKINDSFGHKTGDLVLKEISAEVQNIVRSDDIVARYGGDEFAIILPETDLKAVAVLAERIRRTVEEMEISADTVKIKATISVGAATYVPGGEATGKVEVLDAADAALYSAKNTGRNRLSVVKIH